MLEDHVSPKAHSTGTKGAADGEQLAERVRLLRLPHSEEFAHTRGGWLLRVVCFLLACSTAVLGYVVYSQRSDTAPPNEPSVKSAAPSKATPVVSTSAGTASSGEFALEAKGYIIPAHQILVSPKVNGMVVKLRITESQRVRKGDVLAELEDTEYRADRDRAKAVLASVKHNLEELERGNRPEEVNQARAELAEAEAQQTQLAADFHRSAEMLGKKVISREAYDSALSRYQAMDRRIQRLKSALRLMEEGPRVERIEVARAQVRQAEAELAKAEWRLDNCIIRAPISGTILKKNAEEGSLVNPIAMQGFFSLCEMADLSDLEVDLTIQERDISKITTNQKCKVRAEAFPDRVYEGGLCPD